MIGWPCLYTGMFKRCRGNSSTIFYRIWTNDLGLCSRLDCIPAGKFTAAALNFSIQPGQKKVLRPSPSQCVEQPCSGNVSEVKSCSNVDHPMSDEKKSLPCPSLRMVNQYLNATGRERDFFGWEHKGRSDNHTTVVQSWDVARPGTDPYNMRHLRVSVLICWVD